MRPLRQFLSRGAIRVGFLTIFAFPSAIIAQVDSARLAGLITDPTGAVIAEAKITVKNLRTGAIRETTSNPQGAYLVTNLPPASYEVRAESPGLAAAVISEVPLNVGQERKLDLV